MKSVQHTATMTTCSSVLQLKGHFTKIGRRGCYSRKGKRKMLWFVDYFSQYDLEMLQKFLLYSVKLQWESYGCDRTVSFKFVSLFDRLQLRWSIYNIIILHFNWNLFFFFLKMADAVWGVITYKISYKMQKPRNCFITQQEKQWIHNTLFVPGT